MEWESLRRKNASDISSAPTDLLTVMTFASRSGVSGKGLRSCLTLFTMVPSRSSHAAVVLCRTWNE